MFAILIELCYNNYIISQGLAMKHLSILNAFSLIRGIMVLIFYNGFLSISGQNHKGYFIKFPRIIPAVLPN